MEIKQIIIMGILICGICVGYLIGFNVGNQQYLDIANKQMNLLNDYNDVSNKLFNQNKKVFNQNKELFKSYEESNQELYSCWSETQRLTLILELKYNWEGDY